LKFRPKLWLAVAFVLGVLVGIGLMWPISPTKMTLALPPAQSGAVAHP
jgi:hypothetical protein